MASLPGGGALLHETELTRPLILYSFAFASVESELETAWHTATQLGFDAPWLKDMYAREVQQTRRRLEGQKVGRTPTLDYVPAGCVAFGCAALATLWLSG